jgi:hypothetical protein
LNPLTTCSGFVAADSQLDLPVTELPPYRVRDLLHIGEAGHHLACQLVARAVAAVNISSGVILNTFDALERRELEGLRRDTAVPVFDIGPLQKFSPDGDSSLLLQDRSCLGAFPAESVLYVSFGSLTFPRDLVETAWGIADSGESQHGRVQQCLPDCDDALLWSWWSPRRGSRNDVRKRGGGAWCAAATR